METRILHDKAYSSITSDIFRPLSVLSHHLVPRRGPVQFNAVKFSQPNIPMEPFTQHVHGKAALLMPNACWAPLCAARPKASFGSCCGR